MNTLFLLLLLFSCQISAYFSGQENCRNRRYYDSDGRISEPDLYILDFNAILNFSAP